LTPNTSANSQAPDSKLGSKQVAGVWHEGTAQNDEHVCSDCLHGA
jgi:hypothetical protein